MLYRASMCRYRTVKATATVDRGEDDDETEEEEEVPSKRKPTIDTVAFEATAPAPPTATIRGWIPVGAEPPLHCRRTIPSTTNASAEADDTRKGTAAPDGEV